MSDDTVTQKFEDLKRSFKQLQKNTKSVSTDEMVKQATILMFEITFEMWWKFVQYYIEKRETIIEYGPASTIKQAFELKIITDGEEYMAMLRSRNLIVHVYNENTANEIYKDIKEKYVKLLGGFITKFEKII